MRLQIAPLAALFWDHPASHAEAQPKESDRFLLLGSTPAGNLISVRHSTFESNTIAGIRALGYCHIRENTCMLNLSGIRATGQANRIEGNMTMANTNVGILVEDDSNFILRNYALSNVLNFNIAANNMFGTVIGDVATMNAAPNNSFNVGN